MSLEIMQIYHNVRFVYFTNVGRLLKTYMLVVIFHHDLEPNAQI